MRKLIHYQGGTSPPFPYRQSSIKGFSPTNPLLYYKNKFEADWECHRNIFSREHQENTLARKGRGAKCQQYEVRTILVRYKILCNKIPKFPFPLCPHPPPISWVMYENIWYSLWYDFSLQFLWRKLVKLIISSRFYSKKQYFNNFYHVKKPFFIKFDLKISFENHCFLLEASIYIFFYATLFNRHLKPNQ